MKYLKLCALLLALLLLFAACAGEGTNQKVAGDTAAETGNGNLPQPNDPASDTKAGSDPTVSADPAVIDPTAEPDGTGSAGTEPDVPAAGVSAAFSELFPSCPEQVTAVIVNDPFPNGRPAATVQWNDGAYDRLCVIPRSIGSVVNAYRLTVDADGQIHRDPEPVFTGEAENGSIFGASLERPEGFPAWYLEVVTPDGAVSGLTLEYNGRTGTPACEFVCTAPAEQDELVTSVSGANIVPLTVNDLNAFVLAARKAGLEPWEAARGYFSQLLDIGDAASFIMSYGHEMDGSDYSFRIAKIHENYLLETYGIDDIVAGQYSIYESLGNALGILGPEFSGDLPDLTWQVSGVSVFNRMLAAKEIRLTVDGQDLGAFTLPQDQFVTLIPVELPARKADTPVDVRITVLSTWYGEPAGAWIDAYGGLTSNISGAR